MIIDFSSHLIVSEVEAMLAYRGDFQLIQKNFDSVSSDPVKRIALMDRYGIDTQVLTQSTPVLEGLNAAEAAEVCRISNDAIGQIARAYPDRFVPFAVATLLDVDEAVRELERAVREWGCRGVTIDTNHNNQRLDDPLFHPFFEKVCELDIPVFLHPMAWCSYPLVDDDPAIMRLFGWPFDTTQAFLRLVVSGTMERFPTLMIVTHRLGGGMMPFYGNRFLIKLANLKKNLQRPVSESLERIYGDTAVDGTAAALPLPCGHAFFGTDYPFLLPGAGRVVPEGKSAHREGDDPA